MKRTSALVIFGKNLPLKSVKWWKQFDTIIASKDLELQIQKLNISFICLEGLTDSGSVQMASAMADELARLTLPDGQQLTKVFMYKGYELWWMNYGRMFLYSCLPYFQFRRLLQYLQNYQHIYVYEPIYNILFSYYLKAYGCNMYTVRSSSFRSPSFLPFGILLQILGTFLSIPILIFKKSRLLVFIGDKFDKSCDYDFRMKYVYQELRQRNISFVEVIRSLESWKTVLKHFLIRRRPVIYSKGISFLGRLPGLLFGGVYRAKRKLNFDAFMKEKDMDKRFKLLIATQYMLNVYDDIWAIRIMRLILKIIDIKGALFTAATERSIQTVLACKSNSILTVGIMHSASSKYYNLYDFMPSFSGSKMLSVDMYGVWSKWWYGYYLKNSRAYNEDQLFVSGPMRPLEQNHSKFLLCNQYLTGSIKTLFISEQLSVPEEVLPYLEALLKDPSILPCIKFRPYRDGFENWLLHNRPDLLMTPNLQIFRGNIQEAIDKCDVVVGSNSTAVLEGLLQYKVPIFFNTRKWGDYFSIREYGQDQRFFANDPRELINKIKNSQTISANLVIDLREQYFGDPHQNGSCWMIDQLEKVIV